MIVLVMRKGWQRLAHSPVFQGRGLKANNLTLKEFTEAGYAQENV